MPVCGGNLPLNELTRQRQLSGLGGIPAAVGDNIYLWRLSGGGKPFLFPKPTSYHRKIKRVPRATSPPPSLPGALCSLLVAAAGDLTAPRWAREPLIGDAQGNWRAYERAGLLLAYETTTLINALQPHYHSASAGL